MEKTKQFPIILHWIIGVALMALGYVLPASAPLTDMGVKVLMIFIGMIYLWCTVNPIGGSLLALFAVSVVGYQPLTGILGTAISNQTWIIMFFSIILFVSAIESGNATIYFSWHFQSNAGNRDRTPNGASFHPHDRVFCHFRPDRNHPYHSHVLGHLLRHH